MQQSISNEPTPQRWDERWKFVGLLVVTYITFVPLVVLIPLLPPPTKTDVPRPEPRAPTIAEIRQEKYGPTVGGRIWDQCHGNPYCTDHAKESIVAYIQLEEVLAALGNITRELADVKTQLVDAKSQLSDTNAELKDIKAQLPVFHRL